ncbi:MAG: PKD domain-containing protein [Bacteroidetes bacterium]|nr:PKD domain-containing protein [Bacteroidota bacterium]
MKRTCLTITMTTMLFLVAQILQAQSLRMLCDVNPASNTNELTVQSRTVFNSKIFFTGDNGSLNSLYAMDGNGATNVLPQVTTAKLHNTGSLLIFWGDDGSTGMEPWRSDGTVIGSYLLKNLNKARVSPTTASGSYSEGGITTIGSSTFFGCIESIVQKRSGLVVDYGLYKTDGTPSGTVEIFNGMGVQKLIGLNGNLVVDGWDWPASLGRELWQYTGSSIAPIGTLSAGSYAAENDNPYLQWYTSYHIYNTYDFHSPVTAAGCAFFNTRSENEGNELWCTDGSTLRQITGLTNGSTSTYPVFMTPMDGVLYFVALDETHGSELWRFPLTDPMHSGTATLVNDLYAGSGRSEPCWLTVYNGDLYFSAFTPATGRELFRYDGTAITLVADIATGVASSNPNHAPTDKKLYTDDNAYRFTMTEFNGKLYFAADDGMNGNELWSYDAATNMAAMVWDVNSGAEGSDPRFLTVYNGKLYFTAYTPLFGRAWYEYDPGGSAVNMPPVAVAAATPTSGTAPLTVSFDGSSSSDPDGSITGYAWDFGDGSGTSTLESPSYTYSSAGTYSAQLTVTDNDNATTTDNITISVTSSSTSDIFVDQQAVTRVTVGGGKYVGQSVVLVKDNSGAVPGAVVFATYEGPTSGSVSGTTDQTGYVTLSSASTKKNLSSDWCFTVTDIQLSGHTFNDQMGEPYDCEGFPKGTAARPLHSMMHPPYPNPFFASTNIAFSIPAEQHVCLIVTDMLGREVARLVDGTVRAGANTVTFEAPQLPGGMYFCLMQTSDETQVRTMLLLK